MDKKTIEKHKIQAVCNAFGRFNAWERNSSEKPDAEVSLAAVFEIYDMIPHQARQRHVEVNGIIKMRKGLACLA